MSEPIIGDLIVPGRPDFDNWKYGVTELKRHPQYVYGSTGGSCLVHRILRVEAYWYEAKGDYMLRLASPKLIATTGCQQSFFLNRTRPGWNPAKVCELPAPDAVLCGRCHGDGPVFGKKSKVNFTRREAHKLLGCVQAIDEATR